MPYPAAPRGQSILSRILTSLMVTILLASIVANVYLGAIVFSMYAGQEEAYLPGDGATDQRIVILPVQGLIDDSTATFFHDALLALHENPPAAIVLRVDSGGGYVAPSDQIWNRLVAFKKEHPDIPILASFGATAASGAYYISASADQIWAEPTTITGSIGVIAQAFTFNELLDKVGITPEVIPSTESVKKDMLNPMRPWTEADRDKLRVVLDNAYQRFVEVVALGRADTLTREQVEALATGEIYTVDHAIDLGLVDHKGYLGDVLAAAQAAAGIPAGVQPRVTWLGPPQGFGLLGLFGKAHQSDMSHFTGKHLRGLMLEMSAPRMMYR